MANSKAPHTLKVENCSSHCTTPSERNDQLLVPVKTGCLHVNPATPRGRRVFTLQMLVLCFVPHAALLIQNCSIMAQLSQTLDASLYLNVEVSTSLSLGEAVAALQEERLLIAKTLFVDSKEESDRWKMERAFSKTDSLLDILSSSAVQHQQKLQLYRLREDCLKETRLKRIEAMKRLLIYGEINSVLLLYMSEQVKTTTSSLWRKLAACYELLKAMEESSLVLLATYYENSEATDQGNLGFMDRHQFAALEYLASTLIYLKAEKIDDARMVEEVYEYYKKLSSMNESTLALASGMPTYHALEFELCHGKLSEAQTNLWGIAREAVRREVWVSRRTLLVGVVILTAVLLASPVLVLLIRHTVNTIQTFNRSVEVSTQKLVAEKQKSDLLLSRMLPLPVLRRLRAQRTVPAEAFDAVTIFFSDIVGFTTISACSTPMEVINMLNMLYKLFDEKIMQYNVYKVETIGDAYMVVSGLPQRNGNRHASEIADMSLSLMRSLVGATVPHRPDEALRIRAGVNTGPCVAGVVGTTMPRYCLFGDTINVASRMESTGEAMKIHISDSTKQALDQIGGYEVESRGIIDVAGKGQMETFWLVGKMGCLQSESPRGPRLHDYDQNLLELLIKS